MDAREDSYIQELAARIEALEAAQQPDQIAPEPEWHRLSQREPQDGDRCAYRVAPRLTKELGTWSSIVRRFWAFDKGLFYGDPDLISWRLAMPYELFPQQPAPATEESSATAPSAPAAEPQQPADHIANASNMVAPPAPAGGLVDTICRDLPLSPGEVRAVVREVVAWLRSEPWLGRAAADRLEQEANR
jgi:hypothetical protein